MAQNKQAQNKQAQNKQKDSLSLLRDELDEMRKDGLLDNPSPSFMDKLNTKISVCLKDVFKKLWHNHSRFFTSAFRGNYLDAKKSLQVRNVGIKGYKFDELNPVFSNLYKTRLQSSLDLIKTQNQENMLKLKRRFLDWTTQAEFRNKTDLKEAVKLPKDKQVRFILRDQSNKMSASLDNIIAEKYGAICFEWKTRNDNRVTGKPGGLYPKVNDNSTAHGDHWSRRGKFYYYSNIPQEVKNKLNLKAFAGSDKDLKDGLPGVVIGCRCWSKNYYDLDDLPSKYLKE